MFEFLTHSDLNFEGKKEQEKIIVFTRRHWFILLSPVIGAMFASVIPLILVILGAKILVQYNLSGVFTLCWIIYLMIIWFALFYKLTMHALDTWIVTNERVIDIIQIGLFRRKVSELHLESIQDISVNIHGIVQSYLNFGNIEIQTGATAQRFMFDQVPNPLKIKDEVMEAAGKFEVDDDKKLG
jgi:uncharacterized membrane protein YdbT with pleckstrin-like domain